MLDFRDHEAVKSRVMRLIHDKDISVEDAAAICAHVLFNSTMMAVQTAYGDHGEAEYRRDYTRIIQAAIGTGLPGPKGKAIALAWALKLVQGNLGVGPVP